MGVAHSSRVSIFAVLVACLLCTPSFAQSAPASDSKTADENTESSSHGPPTSGEADEILDELSSQFEKALSSIDETNGELDKAKELKDFGHALTAVDRIIDKVTALADKVRPGNATEVRVDELIANIQAMSDHIKEKGGLDPETLARTLSTLTTQKERLAKGKEVFSSFYPELQAIMEELHLKRRGIAADVMISAYVKAADSLESTNREIQEIIEKLKLYLRDIKEPATQ